MTQPTHPTVKFGDVVRNVNENERNPLENGLERYIGLEHLDPESLHIKRWGLIAEGTSFTRKFTTGQVLFGKRRAYQRKAALAGFDGICSGDILVFEPKSDRLLPELLPFIVQSDRFFEHALRTSAGSLSPRTKWRDLANYEFPLPPLDEQRRIAEILWAADEAIEKHRKTMNFSHNLKKALIDELYTSGIENGQVKETEIGEIPINWQARPLRYALSEKPSYGANAPASEYRPGLPRFVRITDIDDYGQLRSDEVVGLDTEEVEEILLKEGDFLFARTGNTVGKTYLYKPEDGYCVFAGYLVRFRLNPSAMLPEFLFYFTKSTKYFLWIQSTVRVGAQPNINATEYSNMTVPVPPIEEQSKIVNILGQIEGRIQTQNEHLRHLLELSKRLRDNFLS